MENTVTHRIYSSVYASVLALVFSASIAAAQPASSGRIDVPSVPANLEVPEGNEVFLEGQAVGTQNYICLPAATGLAWKFTGPQATLFLSRRGELEQQITTHFLSANPAENNLPRPTWQHSFDSSIVWAKVAASSTDAAYVRPASIPWLLLEAAGTAVGPNSGSLLTRTTFIQRVNTAGGIAPQNGCSVSTDVGAVALVPYTTDYFFYRASR
jgi:hypothetical protein